MPQDLNFIRNSLGLHLFWARIMKEHLLFLQLGLPHKQILLTRQARLLRLQFDRLLSQSILLANSGILTPEFLQAQEIVTPLTLEAELATQARSGVHINTTLTRRERNLISKQNPNTRWLTQRVQSLNRRALPLVNAVIRYKQSLLAKVTNCKIFGSNYPLLIDHVLREAQLYRAQLLQLKNNQTDLLPAPTETEIFWNRIMAEHAKFIRGLLDPTEVRLINIADEFAKLFEQLTTTIGEPLDTDALENNVTVNTLEATLALRDFKAQSTQGLISCEIQAIIAPLLADHVLREANHYVRLLTTGIYCSNDTP